MAQTEYLVTIGCVYIVCTRKGEENAMRKKKVFHYFQNNLKK